MALNAIRGSLAIITDPTAPGSLTAPGIVADGLAAWDDILHGTGSDGECLADMSEWKKTVNTIPIPDGCSLQTATIGGETSPGIDTLTYYLDDTTTPIKDLLVVGYTGYIILAPYGVVAGQRCTTCLVTVLASQPDYEIANQGATFTVTFSKASQTEGRIVA